MSADKPLDEQLLFLAVCLLVRDPEGQLVRRDSVANKAIEKAITEAEYIWLYLGRKRDAR